MDFGVDMTSDGDGDVEDHSTIRTRQLLEALDLGNIENCAVKAFMKSWIAGLSLPSSIFDMESAMKKLNLFCNTCTRFLEKEIISCREAFYCKDCGTSVAQCNECKDVIKNHKQISEGLVRIVDNLDFPCPYFFNGCKETMKRKDVTNHELFCPERFELCQLVGSACKQRVRSPYLEGLVAHLSNGTRTYGFHQLEEVKLSNLQEAIFTIPVDTEDPLLVPPNTGLGTDRKSLGMWLLERSDGSSAKILMCPTVHVEKKCLSFHGMSLRENVENGLCFEVQINKPGEKDLQFTTQPLQPILKSMYCLKHYTQGWDTAFVRKYIQLNPGNEHSGSGFLTVRIRVFNVK